MKRLSIFVVGLLSAVLIFSVAVTADTSKSVSSFLTLSDVIDVDVTDSTEDNTINQDTELDTWNTDESTEILSAGSFTVDVVAMTQYSVGISYNANLTNANPTSLNKDPVQVDSETDYNGNVKGFINGDPDTGSITNLDADFSTENNINLNGTPGESKEYSLNIDPSKLQKDFNSGDEIQFIVTVNITDPSA
ncbi:hypothetical protein KGY79_12620 [Candidatus Bipolaricaulota bacterium]|nr:hypothetical protein [Candidatus Bipolaricaulota bacterium]